MKTKVLKKYPIQVLMMTVTFLITMVLPVLMSYLIDNILESGDMHTLVRWFAVTFSVSVVGYLFKFYFCEYTPVKLGIRNTFQLQKRSASDILRMNQSLYTQKDKGYYYNVCSNSCASYGDLHEETHLKMISCLLYIFSILAVITCVDTFFGIFFLVYGAILVVISLNSSKPLYAMQKVVLPTQDKYLSGIRNIIENKAGINALHTEDYFEKEYTKYVGNYEKFVLRYRFFEYFCSYLPSLINQIFGVAYLFIAAVLVFQGNITAGVLLMGYQYLGYFSNPISIVCGILMRYRSNKIHIERVDELTLDAEQPNELAAYRTEEEAIFAADDLDFYKGDQPEDFLYHIQHMEIRKNGLYLIKGENGSGKSMLMNLILGNITPKNCKGTFSVAKDIDNTAFLTYPIFTVDGSFEDNLYEKPRKDHLIQMLGIDFEDKEIASNPINLSYGQQQKLALYRVFASDTPVFFLDEPLSNLDIETQEKVLAYIKSLKGIKTMLVVMHSSELDDIADGIILIRDHQASIVKTGMQP